MFRFLTGIGLLAATVMIAASATMNFLFMHSLGRTDMEGNLLGVISVAVDVLKALLAVFVAKAMRDGQKAFIAIGGIAFLLFSLGSFLAAVGFASMNRGSVAEGRKTNAVIVGEVQEDVVRLRKQRDELGTFRASAVLDETLAGLRADPRWRQSAECGTPASAAQRDLCRQVSMLMMELARAKEGNRLDGMIATLRGRIDRLRSSGSGEAADPQAKILAQVLRLDEETVQRLLMSLIALIVEASSAFGFYLATGHSPAPFAASGRSAKDELPTQLLPTRAIPSVSSAMTEHEVAVSASRLRHGGAKQRMRASLAVQKNNPK